MRELKARFRSLRDADADPAELAELRREFATCREALREANRDKWIALGYEVDP
jgi:DNA-binding GntR family transcriptional regulator